LTPGFVRHLVKEEEEQQSIGGKGGRDQLIRDGLGIWSRSPVLGVGPGNNYPYMLRYSALGTAHNQYVNILIELGAIGLVCFAVFAYQALRLGLALWRRARVPSHRKLVLSWLGIFGGFLAGGFFGDFMLPSIRNSGLELFAEFYVQWIVLGLIVSAAAIERTYRIGARPHEYA
jgi:O-antigen ligase